MTIIPHSETEYHGTPEAAESPLLRAALWYASHGLPVFPLVPRDKRPLTEHGHLDASTDPATIRAWWTDRPDANIGMPMGAASGLVAVDIDPRNGGAESWEELREHYGAVPDTAEAITGGGGRHIIFRDPGRALPATLAPGIDLKREGYIVVSPSTHPSGTPYQWDGIQGAKALLHAAGPDWLLRVLADRAPANGNGHRRAVPLPEIIRDGQKHHRCVSLAGTMRRRGCHVDEITAALVALSARFESPVPPENLRAIAEDVCRRYDPAADPGAPVEDAPAADPPDDDAARLESLAGEEQGKPGPTPKKPAAIPATVDGFTIFRREFTEPVFAVEGLLARGVTILAGRPKSGKSWFTLQLALAVAGGEKFLGRYPTNAGGVLYVALEEPERRTSDRMRKLVKEPEVWLQNVNFVYRLDPLMTGGAAQLDQLLQRNPCQLVVVDTLLACLSPSNKRDVLRSDYAEVNILRELAEKHQTAILVVHHTRKATADYALDAVAGTTGVTAACDAVWVLGRLPNGASLLTMRGRETEDSEISLSFETGEKADLFGWMLMGDGDVARQSRERQEILELLRDEGKMSPAKVAGALRKNAVTIRRLLQKMLADLWQSFLASHGGRVTAALLEEWRERFAALLEVVAPRADD